MFSFSAVENVIAKFHHFYIDLSVFNGNFTNLIFQHIWRSNDGQEHDDSDDGIEYPQYICIYCENIVEGETQVHDVTYEDEPKQHGWQLAMETYQGE